MLQALDNKMSEWGVALVVVLLLAVVAVAVAVLVRLFGVYHLAHCFASDEERAVLTKSEQTGNGMLVNSESSEFVLDTSGKFVQYDTLNSDPKYMNIDTEGGHNFGHHEDSARSSPVSIGNSSAERKERAWEKNEDATERQSEQNL
ncbi:hypothetical protein C0Q70_11171 [Pomacea canaliculata]|uniref:Uncharacterized protein n=1 Tax=Pomacea canaliculata TaxID=400727 RepID=A0A2T7P590_POMCA|nr:hypothetical protein C0Q70_11171 [Pomacea canaliculata]